MNSIVELKDIELELVEGGILPLVPIIAGGIALVGLAITAFNSGYTVGKDIAETENSRN